MLTEAHGVLLAIGGRSLLDGETVRFIPGIMIALVGPSRCGKTTLCIASGYSPSRSGGAS